jgi:lysophospholipase L1-like esterase
VADSDDTLVQRLPTILGGVLATLAFVIAGLWVSGKSGLPSPQAVLSMAKPPDPLTGPVQAVGDSVLLGAKPCLKGTDIKVNAVENRTMTDGAVLIEQKASAGELHSRVLVALGTNGPFGFKALDRIMRAAGPDRAVYFVTIELPDSYSYEGDVNQRLRAMPGRWPNAHVIDWNASVLVPGLYPDGIHLNPQGCQAYANLILQGVQR